MRPLLQPLASRCPLDLSDADACAHSRNPPCALARRSGLRAFAAALAAPAGLAQRFIELHGPLGAGKTTFVRHLLRALGVAAASRAPPMPSSSRMSCQDGTPVHLALRLLPLRATRANGRTPAFATCSPARAEARRVAREGRRPAAGAPTW
jgi:hypothetical protein